MKLGKVVDHLTNLYKQVKDNPKVRQPLSFSLYHTWRWCQKFEKVREINE